MPNRVLLNLGAGKIDMDRFCDMDYSHIIHVDRGYSENQSKELLTDLECMKNSDWRKATCRSTSTKHYFIGMDLFEFLDNFRIKVDDVMAERIFEHLEFTNGSGQIGRMLEAINTSTHDDGVLSIVVPNAYNIATMLIDMEKNIDSYSKIEFLNKILIINSENHNLRYDAHASSWTPVLARVYIESEGTWQIDKIIENYNFAGRDIYMKIMCSKPKKEKV